MLRQFLSAVLLRVAWRPPSADLEERRGARTGNLSSLKARATSPSGGFREVLGLLNALRPTAPATLHGENSHTFLPWEHTRESGRPATRTACTTRSWGPRASPRVEPGLNQPDSLSRSRCLSHWCERPDSNRHGQRPRDPKSRASTSSATFAGRKLVSRVGVEPTT